MSEIIQSLNKNLFIKLISEKIFICKNCTINKTLFLIIIESNIDISNYSTINIKLIKEFLLDGKNK